MVIDKIELLQKWGCDTKSALERLDGDREFYLECAQMFYEDENFTQLNDALQSSNVQQAFDAAHTIKGVAVNFGFLPLLNAIGEVVEPLRAGDLVKAKARYEEFKVKKAQFDAIVIDAE